MTIDTSAAPGQPAPAAATHDSLVGRGNHEGNRLFRGGTRA